ncbi:MAG TPA: hypothetical protein VGM37_12285 [Armatimonadota bacterium]|jgi:hypothetical protein
MTVARWMIGGVFTSVAVWLIVLNGIWVVRGLIGRPMHASWLPLLGGCTGSVALLILPIEGIRHWWLLPLLIDWGCAPGIIYTLGVHAVWWLRDAGRHGR